MTPLRVAGATVALAWLSALSACGLRLGKLSPEGQAIAQDASESEASIYVSMALSAFPSITITSTQATLSDIVASQADLGQYFSDPSCLTVDTQGNVVTYEFDACTGPWELVEVSGREIGTFSPGSGPGRVTVELVSDELTVNGAAISHEARVEIEVAPSGERAIAAEGHFEGRTLTGRTVVHTGELFVVTRPNGCATLEGETNTSVGARNLEIDYDVERCGPAGTCPTGTVVANASFMQITVEFDGSTEAEAKNRLGAKAILDLDCLPSEGP